jgi:hypothetical protein
MPVALQQQGGAEQQAGGAEPAALVAQDAQQRVQRR